MRPSFSDLALLLFIRIAIAAKLECTEEEASTDKFIDGKWDANWEKVSGDGEITPMEGGGLYFQFTDVQKDKESASLGIQTKKTYTYPVTVTVQMQASDHEGVMSDMILWPKQGQGEIDLELVAKNPSGIMAPIWAPFPEGVQMEDAIPIMPATAPEGSEWATSENGPQIKLNPPKATAAKGVDSKNIVIIEGLDHGAGMHEYKLTYTETTVEGFVDGDSYITWTKGDAAQWPGDGAMHINLAIWRQDAASSWLGEYNFKADALATMSVKQITIEGCAVAGEPEGEGQGSDGQQHKSDGPKEEPEPDDQSNQSTTTAITTSVTSSSVSTSSTPPPPPPPPQTLVLTSDKMVSSLVTITSPEEAVQTWSGYGDMEISSLEQITSEVTTSEEEVEETPVESSQGETTTVAEDDAMAPYESDKRIFGQDSAARELVQSSGVLLLSLAFLWV